MTLNSSLCNLCALCASVVICLATWLTTETQRTQRLHREINRAQVVLDLTRNPPPATPIINMLWNCALACSAK
jgi:hypothetical protein